MVVQTESLLTAERTAFSKVLLILQEGFGIWQ